MFLRIAKCVTTVALLCHAGSALAIFDVQALVGKRWYKWETEDDTHGLASQSLGVAAHLDPIPLVPVSFGVAAFMHDIRAEDWPGGGVDEASVIEAGLDVQAWLPMVPLVTPYVRLNYPLHSVIAAKGKVESPTGDVDVAIAGKLKGFNLHVGAEFSIIPLVSVIVEAGKGMQTFHV